MFYSYGRYADKLSIKGPGLIAGDIVIDNEAQALTMCKIINEVYSAGKKAKALEIKKVLED